MTRLLLYHLLGSCAFPESILETPGDILKISHASTTSCLPPHTLLRPVVSSDLGSWVSTASTCLLLLVERNLTTSAASSVGFNVTFTKRLSSLCHLAE